MRFFILLFLLSLPVAAAEYYTLDSLTTMVSINGGFVASGNGQLQSVEANLSFLPFDTPTQRILDAEYFPDPQWVHPVLRYTWDAPQSDALDFHARTTVRTSAVVPQIRGSIPFPLGKLPAEVLPYLGTQPIIDSDDPRIVALAHELTTGERELPVAVHRIAAWVAQNIKYNLTTANVQAVERASTVLQQRDGVCDELTSLFIAMLRSVGIPARFVAGIAYTNSPQFDNPWGPHGWAEVYFPGIGWVPYDITYEEFGWLDPTHIVAHYSADAGAISLDYGWHGTGVELTAESLDIQVAIVGAGDSLDSRVALSIEPAFPEVGFGSVNRIIVTVHNLRDSIVAVPITLAKPEQLIADGSLQQFVLLPPNGQRQIRWDVSVPELDAGYSYTYPIAARSPGVNATASFSISGKAKRIQRAQLPALLDAPLTSNPPFTLACMLPKIRFQRDERVTVSCTIENTAQRLLNIQLCLVADCQQPSIGAGQKKVIEFRITDKQPGEYHTIVTAQTETDAVQTPLFYTILDEPKLTITEVSSPTTLAFADLSRVQFLIRKTSIADAYNVTVQFGDPALAGPFPIPLFDTDRQFTVELSGADLSVGENTLPITVQWVDAAGYAYHATEIVPITLPRPGIFPRFYLLLRDVGRWVSKPFR